MGAYNNHAYQIWELWIKRADTGECMRVGYLNDGKWEWGVFNQKGVNYDYRFLNDCFTWYGTNETGDASGTLAGTDTDANNVISLRLDVRKSTPRPRTIRTTAWPTRTAMQRCTCARLRRHPKSRRTSTSWRFLNRLRLRIR